MPTNELPGCVNACGELNVAERFASVTCPTRLDAFTAPAYIAYGVGVTAWRGVNVPNAPPPLVRTPSSSQRGLPRLNTLPPKSSVTVNAPLATATALLVSVAETCVPAPTASHALKVRS